jgi:hypothetical protein
MVGAGIWAILTDRPSGVPAQDLAGLSEQCSGAAHIGLSDYHEQFDLTPRGYWMYAYVTVTRLPGRNGRCQLSAPIPNDASHVREYGFHTESTSAPARVLSAVAAVSGVSGPPSAQLGLEYFSPHVDRDGWGEISLSLAGQTMATGDGTGELVTANGSVIGGSRAVPLPEDVAVACPADSNTASAYPAGAIQADSAHTAWTGLNQGTFVNVLCQNPQIRFWVDHATDLIVLGLGAILGILVATEPKYRRTRADKPIPKSATVAAAAPEPGSRLLSLFALVVLTGMIVRSGARGISSR